jgi:hypothetical protein
MLLVLATDLLNKKKGSKVVKFLISEETQQTVADFFAAYTAVIAELEQDETE